MIEGPCKAPSSPPETPVPAKLMPNWPSVRYANGILEEGVPTITTMSPLSKCGKSVDGRVRSSASLNHKKNLTWRFKAVDEFFYCVGPYYLPGFCSKPQSF